MASATVNMSQLIGKDLYGKSNVNVRERNSIQSPLLISIKKGDRIGTIFSWAYGKDETTGKKNNEIWLELDEDYGKGKKNAWVLFNPSYLDFKSLQQQGVKTVEEETKAKEEEKGKSWIDDLLDGLGLSGGAGGSLMKTVKTVAIIWAGAEIYSASQEGKRK